MDETLGERLARLRKEHGFNQDQIGELVGLDRRAISSYEQDIRLPVCDTIVKLSKIFHVTTDYILGIDTKNLIRADGLAEEEYLWFASLINDLADKNKQLAHRK